MHADRGQVLHKQSARQLWAWDTPRLSCPFQTGGPLSGLDDAPTWAASTWTPLSADSNTVLFQRLLFAASRGAL